MLVLIKTREELVDYIHHGNNVELLFFWGHQKPKNGVSKSCFSQWYDAPFECDGYHFMTAEHYMMHKKALLFGDMVSAEKVLSASNPGEAKAIGREVKGFNNEKWIENRFEIVVNANVAKFSSNTKLKEFLLNTGEQVLVEASPVDRIWGIGLAEDHPTANNPSQWKGLNVLGFALMVVRDNLAR